MDRRLPVLLFFVAPAALAQATFRGDAAHTGAFAGPAPREFHRVKWTFPTGDRVVGSPTYHDGAIFIGGDDGAIYAIDARDGTRRWKRMTKGPAPSSPAVADGVVYALSYDGKCWALDEKTGEVRWKFATGGERRFEAKGIHGLQPKNQTIPDPFDVYLSSPAVAGGTVVFGSGDGGIYALDAATGAQRWRFETGDVVHASPAVANGVVYAGSWDGRFYAIDLATGKERWHFQGGLDPALHNQQGFQSSPAVVDGVVYTGSRDSNVYALDAATGAEKWRFSTGASWVNSTSAVAGGKVFFATSDSKLWFVVDAANGKELVQQKNKAYAFSSPALAGDVALLGIGNGTLIARDRDSAAPLWEFVTEAAKRNEGWALTSDGDLNFAWLYRWPWRETPMVAHTRQLAIGAVLSSPLVVDGVVYFGSTDGNVYAIE
jgi:outer membrane protein assembly factor BamB